MTWTTLLLPLMMAATDHPRPGDVYRPNDGDWVVVLDRRTTPDGTDWISYREGTDPQVYQTTVALSWFRELIDVGALDGRPRPRYQLVQAAP